MRQLRTATSWLSAGRRRGSDSYVVRPNYDQVEIGTEESGIWVSLSRQEAGRSVSPLLAGLVGGPRQHRGMRTEAAASVPELVGGSLPHRGMGDEAVGRGPNTWCVTVCWK